jgi:hypothetical protein
MPERRIHLELAFCDLDRDLVNVVAVIHIEDTAEADAPARSLAVERFPGLSVSHSEATATVVVTLPDLTGAKMPSIRVHVDTDGAGAIRPGHFLNPAATPVPGPSVHTCRIELVRVD